jgi:hypothetical protein
MRKFVACSESKKLPTFIELCHAFCDERWIADQLDDEQVARHGFAAEVAIVKRSVVLKSSALCVKVLPVALAEPPFSPGRRPAMLLP